MIKIALIGAGLWLFFQAREANAMIKPEERNYFTRGERNNNPGNIRISNSAWQGKISGSDQAFETFQTPSAGIRAIAVLLRNYSTKYGANTIRKIISRYAPSSENNTAAYITAVSRDTGYGPDQLLDLFSNTVMNNVVTAIIKHENGRVIYSANIISNAIKMA